jgi:hypothetical protein
MHFALFFKLPDALFPRLPLSYHLPDSMVNEIKMAKTLNVFEIVNGITGTRRSMNKM